MVYLNCQFKRHSAKKENLLLLRLKFSFLAVRDKFSTSRNIYLCRVSIFNFERFPPSLRIIPSIQNILFFSIAGRFLFLKHQSFQLYRHFLSIIYSPVSVLLLFCIINYFFPTIGHHFLYIRKFSFNVYTNFPPRTTLLSIT